MQIPRWLVWIALTWTLLFWVSMIAVPLVFVLLQLFSVGATQSVWDPSVLHVANATFTQALLSTVISAVLGTSLGLWIRSPHLRSNSSESRTDPSWAHTLLAIPYSIPTVVAAQAWVMWLGRSGILADLGLHLDWMYSLKAVILAHVFFNTPLVALMVSQAKLEVPRQQIESALLLGANRWSCLRWIVWPYIKWSAASSWAQVMALCAMSFGLVLILGGGPPVQTLEVEIYQSLRTGNSDLSRAVICAFWELVITLGPWALVLIFNFKRHQVLKEMPNSSFVRRTDKPLGLMQIAVILFFIFPYGVIFNSKTLGSFLDPIWQREVMEPLKVSSLLAFMASGMTLLTSVMAVVSLRYAKKWGSFQAAGAFLLGMPSGISVLVLGLGVWLAYGRWVDPFDGSLIAIVVLQTTLAFPFSLRLLLPLLKGLQIRELEAAVLLGASPVSAFWAVEWPRWREPIIRVLSVSAASSLGELGAVSLFYSEKLIPLPLFISRLMQQYRFGDAQGVSALLFVLCLLLMGSGLMLNFRIKLKGKS